MHTHCPRPCTVFELVIVVGLLWSAVAVLAWSGMTWHRTPDEVFRAVDASADGQHATLPLRIARMKDAKRVCQALMKLTLHSPQAIHRVKEGQTIDVLTSSDKKYLPGLIALINSCILHTRNPLAFHIVADVKSDTRVHMETLLRTLYPKGRFAGQSVSFEVVGFNASHVRTLIKTYASSKMTDPSVHANPYNFARFYFHELFPKVSRAVYLDPDTIMLGNIGELGTMLDHQDEFLYAVAQGMPHTYAEAFNWKMPVVQQSFNRSEPYFNAGVAVINLKRWRQDNITGIIEHWMAMHKEHPLWSWGTQPPLMAAFYRRYHLLDGSWNLRHLGVPGQVPQVVELLRAKVLHWNGANKPWKSECRRDSSCFFPCWATFLDAQRIRNVLSQSSILSHTFSDALIPYLQ